MYARLILLVLVASAITFPAISTAQSTTYTDPFAYCAAVGTIDALDARYVGANVPDAIKRGLENATQSSPGSIRDAGTFWRCMNSRVYACTVGANLPCQEKADTSQTPTQPMIEYCRNSPNAFIPAAVTGHATVYLWQCQNGVATPGRQGWQVDAQGFIANIWYALSPQSATGPQTLPTTSGASTDTPIALAVIGVGIALLGIVFRRRLHRG